VLHILHLNDTEASPDQVWPRVATLVQRARAEGQCDLLLHAGDIRLAAVRGWEVVRVLNRLDLTAFTPGNHDLDDGIDLLARQLDALSAVPLCSNVVGFGRFQQSRIYLRNGIRVALCGVTLEDMAVLQPDRNIRGLRFLKPSASLLPLLPQLRQKADAIVVLSHCGLEADVDLAREAPDIDVIIGGHSHHLLKEPLCIGKTRICQVGAWGEHVGWIRLDMAGGCLSVAAGVIPTAGLEPDAEVLGLTERSQARDDEIIGHTRTDLRAADNARETPLGNLIADLIREVAGADISLLRCSTVNNSLPPGPIRQADLDGFSFTPHDQIACCTITGHELLQVLECGARDRYYLLNTSGVRITYDGTRAQGMRVLSTLVDGQPLMPDRQYLVACSEILARGAAGFDPFRGKPYRLLAATIQQVVTEHILAAKVIAPSVDGRLTIVGDLPRRQV